LSNADEVEMVAYGIMPAREMETVGAGRSRASAVLMAASDRAVRLWEFAPETPWWVP
jgi:hypothetical protein